MSRVGEARTPARATEQRAQLLAVARALLHRLLRRAHQPVRYQLTGERDGIRVRE